MRTTNAYSGRSCGGRSKLFAWMIPGEARVFPRSELEQAKAWVAGDA